MSAINATMRPRNRIWKHLFSYIVLVAFATFLYSGSSIAQPGSEDDEPRAKITSPRLRVLSRRSSSQKILRRSSQQATSPRTTFFALDPNCTRLREMYVEEITEAITRRTGQVLFRSLTPSVEVIQTILENSDAVHEFKKRVLTTAIAEIKRIKKDKTMQEVDPITQKKNPTKQALVHIVGATLQEFFNPNITPPALLVILVKTLNEAVKDEAVKKVFDATIDKAVQEVLKTSDEPSLDKIREEIRVKLREELRIHPLLGAVVFLRCICPALSRPEDFRKKTSDYTRETLRLVAKALQLMTNQVAPDEQHAFFPIREQLASLQSATMHALDQILRTTINEPVHIADVPIGETTLKEILSPPEILREVPVEDDGGRLSPYACTDFHSN